VRFVVDEVAPLKFLSEFMRFPLHCLLFISHHPFRGATVVARQITVKSSDFSFNSDQVLGLSRKIRIC